MIGFIFRRLGQAVIVVLGVILLTFILEHLIPGNVARGILGPRATPVQLHAFVVQNDLNRAIPYQFVHYLVQLLHGNLGRSYHLNRTVNSVLASELPRDVFLVGISLTLSVIIAIPIGVAQAVKRNGIVDYTATSVSFLLYSMPSFAFGLIMIQLFAIQFRLFPPEAPQQVSVIGMITHPKGLVLPVLTLTLINYALFSRYMRSAAIENLAQDYIRTARAKGLPERLVLWRHLLRNSLVPIATLVGLSLPAVLTFGLIVEQLFNFPGVGLQYFLSATQSDYPVMLGIIVLIGLATVVGNLAADIAYAVLDPRVRYN